MDGVEHVWTGGGNDVLIGDDRPNTFYTGWACFEEKSLTESLTGHGGADRITFNSEWIEGGSSPGGVRVNLAARAARWQDLHTPAVMITLTSIENVTGTEYGDVS